MKLEKYIKESIIFEKQKKQIFARINGVNRIDIINDIDKIIVEYLKEIKEYLLINKIITEEKYDLRVFQDSYYIENDKEKVIYSDQLNDTYSIIIIIETK